MSNVNVMYQSVCLVLTQSRLVTTLLSFIAYRMIERQTIMTPT